MFMKHKNKTSHSEEQEYKEIIKLIDGAYEDVRKYIKYNSHKESSYKKYTQL